MKTIISTNNAPAAIGPYSQGIAASGKMVFVSGQIPIDPATGAFAADDIKGQTEQSLKNVGAILAEADANVARINADAEKYRGEQQAAANEVLAHIADFGPMNEVYAKYFNGDCPARAAFAVKDLPKGALVEIEAIAVKE